MGYGEIYVEVTANSVNPGISLMDASGATGSGEGGTSGVYWILWEYNVSGEIVTGGYTGQNWYWDTIDNYLKTGWSNFRLRLQNLERYTDDLTGFENYLIDNPNLPDLNGILGAWPMDQKDRFATANQEVLASNNCFTFGSRP